MKLSKNDIIFTGISLVVIFTLVFLLYDNINYRQRSSADAQAIGTVIYKHHRAKRKFMDRFIWEKVSLLTPVYLFDSVMTLQESYTIIRLSSGAQIALDPETLVEIDFIDDKVGFNLERGGFLSQNSGAELTIRTKDNTKIILDKGESRISQGNGEMMIAVQKGKASVMQNNQKIHTVDQNEILMKNKEGGWSSQKFSYSLKSPENNGVHYLPEDQGKKEVRFSWTGNPRYLLVSSHPFMKSPKVHWVKNQSQITLNLPPGVWYWSTSSENSYKIDPKIKISPIGSFIIKKEKKIEVFQPANNTVFVQSGKGKKVSFSWKNTDDVEIYHFVLSRNPDFSNPIYQTDTSNTSLVLSDLPEGRYYWRASEKKRNSPVAKDTASSSSHSYSFKIRRSESGEKDGQIINASPLEAEKMGKEDKTEKNKVELLYPPKEKPLFSAESVSFRWVKNPKAVLYSVTIKNDRGKTIQNIKTRKNYIQDYRIPQPLRGNKKITVVIEAKDKTGKTISTSHRQYTILTLQPPSEKSIRVSLRKPK